MINNNIAARHLQLQKSFKENPYPNYKERVSALIGLKESIIKHKEDLVDALSKDFGYRSGHESLVGDIFTTISSINYTLKHLKQWMKPQRKSIDIQFQPGRAEVIYQPLGVVGVIAPWNYPIFLALSPLVTAVAAGNKVMLKTSEFTPNTNEIIVKLLSEVFSDDQVVVILGGVESAIEFTKLPLDHLFFTGSTAVGKEVMRQASKNLVPCTLELGGKSPVIIDQDIDINHAVSRFIYGKTFNAGQTCVAPDYIFCPKNKIEQLIIAIQSQYKKMYTDNNEHQDSTHIINQAQYKRLSSWVEDAKQKGANVYPLASKKNESDTFFPLTLISNCSLDMTVMKEEIFGPLFPIIGYSNRAEITDFINQRERPLALYIFSHNKVFQEYILENTHSGGVCINDASFHVAIDDLPFGGVGHSGFGQYHGKEGFLTLSHAKSVLKRGKSFYPISMLFPPYGSFKHNFFYKRFIR